MSRAADRSGSAQVPRATQLHLKHIQVTRSVPIMTASHDASDQDRSPEHALQTAEAERELVAAESTVRSGARWHAYELLTSAFVLSGTTFVYGAYRTHLSTWLFVCIPVACVLAFAIARRRRIFGHGEARDSRIAMTAAILLLLSTLTILGQLASANPSAWTVTAIASMPAVPLLVVAFRALYK